MNELYHHSFDSVAPSHLVCKCQKGLATPVDNVSSKYIEHIHGLFDSLTARLNGPHFRCISANHEPQSMPVADVTKLRVMTVGYFYL